MERRDFLYSLGALAFLTPKPGQGAVKADLPAEGTQLAYRLKYGDNEIGTQKVLVKRHDTAGHVVLEHRLTAEIKLLFATVYSIDHTSTEVWDGFELKSLQAETVENGERVVIAGQATEDGFRIDNGEKEWVVKDRVVSSDSFWVAAALNTSEIVNVRTGDIAAPETRKIGDNAWHVSADFEHGPMEAKIYFDGPFMTGAEITTDGHTVTVERI